MIKQVGKFLIAGLSAAGMELGSFVLLFYVLHLPLPLANGFSFGAGLITSFTLNRQWAFFTDGFDRRMQHQFIMYCTLALINLLLTLLFVQVFANIGIAAGISKFLAMAITSSWNFLLYKKVVFRKAA